MMIKPRLLFGEPAPLLLSRHTKKQGLWVENQNEQKSPDNKEATVEVKKTKGRSGGGVDWDGVGRTMKSCLFLLELCFEELSVKKLARFYTSRG